MSPSSPNLLTRLDDLASRIEEIESRLGITDHPVPKTPPVATQAAVPAASKIRTAPAAERAPLVPEPAAKQPFSLERFIGGRFFAIAGALVVIVGAALGLKLAWDQGYFGQLSDTAKSALMAAFGIALLIAGELSGKRYGKAAGEGPSAAGLGVLYATVYAMAAHYELLAHAPAIGALFGITILGFAISARAGMVVVPAVAIIGGFLTPMLLDVSQAFGALLAFYWIALTLLAHMLMALHGPTFAPARTCAWWGTLLVGGVWAALTFSDGNPAWAVFYVAAIWLITHAELWRTATLTGTKKPWSPFRLQLSITTAISTTLWTTGFGFLAADHYDWIASWHPPAVLALASVVIALLIARGPRALFAKPSKPTETLAVALALIAGALTVFSLLLALGDWFEPVIVTLLGLASIAAGTRVCALWLRFYGKVVLSLGTILALGATPLLDTTLATPGGLILTQWSTVVAIAGIAWLAVAFIRRTTDTAPAFAFLSLILLGAALYHNDADMRWLSATWAILSLAFFFARRIEPRLMFDIIGLAGLLTAALSSVTAYYGLDLDSGKVYGSGVWSIHQGLLAGFAHIGLVIVASLSIIRRATRSSGPRNFAAAGLAIAAGLLLLATSLETARLAEAWSADQTAQRAAVSVWWGIYAVGLLTLGALRRAPAARYAGLALLGVATLKAVIFDLADIAPGWRVASFLALGLLLLGVATAYARSTSRQKATTDPPR